MSRPGDPVVWHDVECAAYKADLPLWRELVAARGGPVLELGCGTGRVALDLAAEGHDVTGLDADPALVRALAARARRRGLPVRGEVGDARSFELGRSFAIAIAPMQVVQLLGGEEERRALLECTRRHLEQAGLLAIALADPLEGLPAGDVMPPLPDVLEEDGWVFSSTPVSVRENAGGVAIDRLRQSVSPEGELSESSATISLDAVKASELEREAEGVGFRALPARHVPPTPDYVGSVVVVLEAA